jgi:hypothetical protein
VDLSGIIFVLLAVAWAVFLIPKALRHHDEVARTRSIDRFSTSVRVVAHREPVNDRDSRLVVTPSRSASSPRVANRTEPAPVPAVPVEPALAVRPRPDARPDVRPDVRSDARRKAARVAARRRRRILVFLLLCDVAVAAIAYFALVPQVPLWSVAVPAGLTLLFLVLCRTQVRHEPLPVAARRAPAEPVDVPVEAEVPADVPFDAQAVEHTEYTQYTEYADPDQYVDRDRVADFDDTEDTAGIPVAQLQAALQPTADGGALWDPLPVTLPTYVTKAKASRTVRTIDLGEPGTWTSGRTAEDSDIAAQAADAQAATERGPDKGTARAVGS